MMGKVRLVCPAAKFNVPWLIMKSQFCTANPLNTLQATKPLPSVRKLTDEAPEVSPLRVTVMLVLGPLSVLLKLVVLNWTVGGGVAAVPSNISVYVPVSPGSNEVTTM